MGFQKMTQIQEKAIPSLLKGRFVVVTVSLEIHSAALMFVQKEFQSFNTLKLVKYRNGSD